MTSCHDNTITSFETMLEAVRHEENCNSEDDNNLVITSVEEADEQNICSKFEDFMDTDCQGFDNIHIGIDCIHQEDDVMHKQDDNINHNDDGIHEQDDDTHKQIDGIHQQDDGIHQQDDGIHQQDDGIHQQDDGIHQQHDGIHQQHDGIHQIDELLPRKTDGDKYCSKEETFDDDKDIQSSGNLGKLKPFPSECGICHKLFQKRYLLVNHLSIHTGERNYECSICEKRFRIKRTLQQHMSRHKHADNKRYKCQVCPKSYDNLTLFNEHTNGHLGVRFQCSYCEKSFSASSSLKAHLKLHANPDIAKLKYYTCNICAKQYVTESALRMHMDVHHGTQERICDMCDARFSRKHDLQRHMFIHTGEKPYKCSLCPRAYRQPGELGRHMAWHRGDHTCKYCGRKYARKDEFLRHVSYHERELKTENESQIQFQCKVCKKVLISEINLQQHQKIHQPKTVKKKCEDCGIIFSTNSNFNRHIREKHNRKQDDHIERICDKTTESVVTGSFECDLCSKMLKSKRSLTEHINDVHLKNHNHACIKCNQTFYRKKDLERHTERKHKNDS